MDHGTFAQHHKFFFVRNALNYFSPAQFDDQLVIYTRVAALGRTSITLEQIMNLSTGRRILECESVMVSVDETTDGPRELEPELRQRLEVHV
jgi:YbgC/YbaW family acyl-CoA thioester hydrolase